jgi:LmbE family N-acetylglucosaminyl deacetylase
VQQLKDYVRTFFRPINLISIPQVVERPPGDCVAVLAPHFDDDVIGCGGTLHKHILAGNKVTVVYFTDGREGDPSFHDKELLGEMRKEEAISATKLLGIEDLIFLDEPETKLRSTSNLINRLHQILHEVNPDLLYVPSFLDNHIDHFEVNRVLLSLSKRLKCNLNIAAYEVWTPILPNIIVDITPLVSKKEEALKQYKTQIRQVDYVSTTLALNRYRSLSNFRGHGYAEVFFYTSFEEYKDFMKGLKLSKRLFINRN